MSCATDGGSSLGWPKATRTHEDGKIVKFQARNVYVLKYSLYVVGKSVTEIIGHKLYCEPENNYI